MPRSPFLPTRRRLFGDTVRALQLFERGYIRPRVRQAIETGVSVLTPLSDAYSATSPSIVWSDAGEDRQFAAQGWASRGVGLLSATSTVASLNTPSQSAGRKRLRSGQFVLNTPPRPGSQSIGTVTPATVPRTRTGTPRTLPFTRSVATPSRPWWELARSRSFRTPPFRGSYSSKARALKTITRLIRPRISNIRRGRFRSIKNRIIAIRRLLSRAPQRHKRPLRIRLASALKEQFLLRRHHGL